MGIVGVKSTAGREVKFIDPSKTTRSESAWLGYPLCALYLLIVYYVIYIITHTVYYVYNIVYYRLSIFTIQ